jgi:hypothetical protein
LAATLGLASYVMVRLEERARHAIKRDAGKYGTLEMSEQSPLTIAAGRQ